MGVALHVCSRHTLCPPRASPRTPVARGALKARGAGAPPRLRVARAAVGALGGLVRSVRGDGHVRPGQAGGAHAPAAVAAGPGCEALAAVHGHAAAVAVALVRAVRQGGDEEEGEQEQGGWWHGGALMCRLGPAASVSKDKMGLMCPRKIFIRRGLRQCGDAKSLARSLAPARTHTLSQPHPKMRVLSLAVAALAFATGADAKADLAKVSRRAACISGLPPCHVRPAAHTTGALLPCPPLR